MLCVHEFNTWYKLHIRGRPLTDMGRSQLWLRLQEAGFLGVKASASQIFKSLDSALWFTKSFEFATNLFAFLQIAWHWLCNQGFSFGGNRK